MKVISLHGILIILLCILSCTDPDDPDYDYVYEPFDLWIDNGIQNSKHLRELVFIQFKHVALGSEFGDQRAVIKKWVTPMKVFVATEIADELNDELLRIIDDLNYLFLDGFSITVVDKLEDSNLQIYIGNSTGNEIPIPIEHSLIESNQGLFLVNFNAKNEIESGVVFVKSELISLPLQKHILREELTQSLGLGNDLPFDKWSIFYAGDSRVIEYSRLDIDIIRLMHHPAITPGLGETQVDFILKRLLELN